MLNEVRSLWYEIDKKRGLMEIKITQVAEFLSSNINIFQDTSTAIKYI